MFTFPITLFNANSTGILLTYVSNGDTNGLIYYLGTNKLTTSFSIPNSVTITASSNLSASDPTPLINRVDDEWYSTNNPNQYITIGLFDNLFKVNRYNIKTRTSSNTAHPRNFKLQGSTDNTTWTDLDIRTNYTVINAVNTWYTIPIVTSNYYRYIRLANTGVDSSGSNYLCFNELELYGELIDYIGTTVSIPFDTLGGNDIFYYLGTNKLTTSFSNPSTSGQIILTASSTFSDPVSNVTDRTNNNFATSNISNSFILIDFYLYKIKPNYYVIQNRSSFGDNNLRTWKLQGSNNNTTWTDLDIRTNDTSITTVNQKVGFSCTSSSYYRYIKLIQTGLTSDGFNYLCLGELYIYGDLMY